MDIVPVNDLKRLTDEDLVRLKRAADDVLKSGWWINGPHVQRFCEAFALTVDARHCMGLANGTDALEIAMRALIARWCERRSNSKTTPEIVMVANAGGYATTACRLVGATPVYTDIESGSLLIDPDKLRDSVSEKTAIVVATHLYGGLVDVPALRRALDDLGFSDVAILEDCAQAHGLSGRIGKAGALGAIAAYSFYPTKNLGALGDGGALLTNDDALADAARQLRQYGWQEKYRVVADHGRNSRLDEMQAAFLQCRLPDLGAMNARRVAILEAYEKAALEGMVRVIRSPGGTVAHLAVVVTPDRESLRAHMRESGVATEVHYPILDCDQPGWNDGRHRIGAAGLGVSRQMADRILTLPCFPRLTDGEVDRVCRALTTFTLQ